MVSKASPPAYIYAETEIECMHRWNADMPNDPHLEGQTHILANQPTFSCSKFVLALMEWPHFKISLYFVLEGGVKKNDPHLCFPTLASLEMLNISL